MHHKYEFLGMKLKRSLFKLQGTNFKLCVLSTLLWDNPGTPFTLVKKKPLVLVFILNVVTSDNECNDKTIT